VRPPADDDEDDEDDDDDDDDEPVVDDKAEGNALLIGAGATAFAGAVANAFRMYVVTVPCQTPDQHGCTPGWVAASVFAWGFNSTSIGLVAAGGHVRGRRDATYDRAAHRRRKPGALAAGATLLSLGFISSVLLRTGWLADYDTPEGPELFDFARPGHSLAYYGGLQLSSWVFVTGVGLLFYGAAKPRRRNVSVAPTATGFTIQGRF
jgi:hypothetical protein